VVVFIVYILSCVIYKFFSIGRIGSVYEHLHLALFRPDDHRLVPQAPDHVKRIPGSSPKRQLQGVFLNAFFQRLLELMGDLEEPVGRTQPADALMRPLVVVQIADIKPIRPNIRKSVIRGIRYMLRQ
jgi:hypothetical protein